MIMDKVQSIDILFNTIRIRGIRKGVFGEKYVSIRIGRIGVLTNIIAEDCRISYPKDKMLQSHATKVIEIGKEMH